MFRRIGFLLILCCFTTGSAYAQSIVPHGNFSALSDLFDNPRASNHIDANSASTRHRLARKIFVGGKAHRLGRFRVAFDIEKSLSFTQPGQNFRLLQGMADGTGRDGPLSVPVAGNVLQRSSDKYEMRLFFLNEGIGRGIAAGTALIGMKMIIKKGADGSWTVAKVVHPAHRLRSRVRNCGVEDHGTPLPSSVSASSRSDIGTFATFRTVTVILEGDTELNNSVPDFQAELADHANTADLWYMRDLGVSLSVTIVSAPQSYSSGTNYVVPQYTYPLHDEMRAHRPASSRTEYIHFLITGKSNDDGLAGVVPDLGTICVNKSDSIGFTISYEAGSTFDKETTAHEMGHLFGAEHDDAQTGNVAYLMFSGTSSRSQTVSEFSTYSQNQVGAFLDENPSCLGSEEGELPPSGGGGDSSDPADSVGSIEFIKRGFLRYLRGVVVAFPYDLDDYQIRRGVSAAIYCGPTIDGPFDTYITAKPVRRWKARFVLWSSQLGDNIFCKAIIGNVASDPVQVLLSPYE